MYQRFDLRDYSDLVLFAWNHFMWLIKPGDKREYKKSRQDAWPPTGQATTITKSYEGLID